MLRNGDHDAARFGGPPSTRFELPRRRALPAAVGGRPSGAVGLLLLIAMLLALLAMPGVARAEEVFTSQAAAANATDSTWIPAPARKAALCIVDTGNDVTPDTANVIARFAPDGGTVSDRSPVKHGTLMSMIASAPFDGFGMVGAAPSINVVSVVASANGEQFGGSSLKTAIQVCMNKRSTYNIRVISMSLGGDYHSDYGNPGQIADTETFIDNARRAGLNVVAAAGNGAQGTTDWPAGYGPTFAVGAADDGGGRCPFASGGPEVDIWAPGCPLDVGRPDSTGTAAWSSGSSEATAFVGAILTQVRGLDPALTADDAEALLKQNAKTVMAGLYLDVAAAFAADGLAADLVAGHAATPTASALPPTTAASQPASATLAAPDAGSALPPTRESQLPAPAPEPRALHSRLSTPRISSAKVRHGLLTIGFRAKPRTAEACVQIYARRAGRAFPRLVRTIRTTGDRLSGRVSGTLSQLSITYRDPGRIHGTSAPLVVRLRN